MFYISCPCVVDDGGGKCLDVAAASLRDDLYQYSPIARNLAAQRENRPQSRGSRLLSARRKEGDFDLEGRILDS
jgi:hypothetical protein